MEQRCGASLGGRDACESAVDRPILRRCAPPDAGVSRRARDLRGFPFGQACCSQTADGGVKVDVDAEPSVLELESKATAVSASFNGTAAETTRDAAGNWIVRTK